MATGTDCLTNTFAAEQKQQLVCTTIVLVRMQNLGTSFSPTKPFLLLRPSAIISLLGSILLASTAFLYLSCNKLNSETAVPKLAGTYKGDFFPGLNPRDRMENYVVKIRTLSQETVRVSAESAPAFETFEVEVTMVNGTISFTKSYLLFY